MPKLRKLTFNVYKLMEESDGPYFQKLREISHSNLHVWKDKELINSQQNDKPIM